MIQLIHHEFDLLHFDIDHFAALNSDLAFFWLIQSSDTV